MTQKTVRVRIAVVVRPDGLWDASGRSGQSDADNVTDVGIDDNEVAHFIEANVPLPTSVTVEGEVVK